MMTSAASADFMVSAEVYRKQKIEGVKVLSCSTNNARMVFIIFCLWLNKYISYLLTKNKLPIYLQCYAKINK